MIGLLVSIAVLGPFAASLLLSGWLRRSARPRVVRSLAEPPAGVQIVVLGCRPRTGSGRPNRYLIGRIASAAAAYHHTAGRRILCSGFADEVAAIAEGLERARVPRSALDFDETSRRTIDSIEIVAARHADQPVLLVTQPFHMPRTLFLARWRGVEAWGLIAAGPAPGWRSRMREKLAELRAVCDRVIGRRRPNCYGPR